MFIREVISETTETGATNLIRNSADDVAGAVVDPKRTGHVFRNNDGHVNPSTTSSQNRYNDLFRSVADSPNNFRPDLSSRPDKAAANINVFTQNFKRGQVWVEVRNGKIQNAGVNRTPK